MKKITSLLMALMMVLTLSQCKPDNGDGGTKIKVRCNMPVNDEERSDFISLLGSSKINWSNGNECIYLAVHGDDPQIIELKGMSDGTLSNIEFTGEAAEGLIVSGEEYDVWYFGHSQQLETPYYSLSGDGRTLTGSIAKQSGRLKDLGYNHIAKATVAADVNGDNVTLNIVEVMTKQIAIAYLDLKDITHLKGNAVVGTEYALQHSNGSYELVVAPNDNANIAVADGVNNSFVVLFPTAMSNVDLKSSTSKKITFENGLEAKAYYQYTDMEYKPLAWEEIEEEDVYEYVNLGLSVKWATCNVGASSPEAYGDYFAWGETAAKTEYTAANCSTYNVSMNDISGDVQYDAAAANWGGDWRMPTKAEQQELLNNCTWTWTTQNGINGYRVTSKTNGNSIFLPAAGYRSSSSLSGAEISAYYWASTPSDGNDSHAFSLYFTSGLQDMNGFGREYGYCVRPVCAGPQYATVTTSVVTEITSNSAVCGGNVTTDNGWDVIERGVCWSTSPNPTIQDYKSIDGAGVGNFTSNITGLVSMTRFYVRAYATNAAGTSYGEEISFMTLSLEQQSYVDLGLSVKWASCNVGASTPEEYGDYFAWGETTTKSNYSSSSCPTYGLSIPDLQVKGYVDGDGNLTAYHDAAAMNWGGSWRMPTYDELNELITNCTWTWVTTQNGVRGYNVTGPNGNSIFLPIAGYMSGTYLYTGGGNYWSSTPYKFDGDECTYTLKFDSANHFLEHYIDRNSGKSVRPVQE